MKQRLTQASLDFLEVSLELAAASERTPEGLAEIITECRSALNTAKDSIRELGVRLGNLSQELEAAGARNSNLSAHRVLALTLPQLVHELQVLSEPVAICE